MLVRWIRRMKIRQRLIVAFLLVCVVPIISIFFFIIHDVSELLLKNVSKISESSMYRIESNFSAGLENFEKITDEILWSTGVINSISHYNSLDPKEQNELQEHLSSILTDRTTFISDVVDFTVYNNQKEKIYDRSFIYISEIVKENAINKMQTLQNQSLWDYGVYQHGNYFILTKPIKYYSKTYGYIFIAIKEQVFKRMYEELDNNFNGYSFVANEKWEVMSSSHEEKLPIGTSLNNIVRQKESEQIGTNVFLYENKGGKYIVGIKDIERTKMSLVNVIPYKNVTNIYDTFNLKVIAIIIVMLILSVAAGLFIYASIMKPLQKVVVKMNNINEQSLYEHIEDTGRDEISVISSSFNKMVGRIGDLVGTVKRQEKEKRDLELRMLQAQINPHFLFNTLGSIRYIALMSRVPVVAEGLEALSNLLRSTIIHKEEMVTVREEVENVKNYVTLQKLRYGDAFEAYYDFDEDILDKKITKFILQPIVENAILHAFDNDSENNDLFICGRYEDNKITLEVIDNGKGMSKGTLEKMRENKLSGIGINNVKERIHLHFGEDAIFKVESIEGKGTSVIIQVDPRRKQCD